MLGTHVGLHRSPVLFHGSPDWFTSRSAGGVGDALLGHGDGRLPAEAHA
jgi:hypothetical protein